MFSKQEVGRSIMSRMITQSIKTIHGVDLRTPQLIEPPPRTTLGPPPEELTIVCVWWGNLYPVKYVETLYNMVKRNLSIPYEFVCLTDQTPPNYIKKIPLNTTKKGWWNKIHLFDPDLFNPSRRILYFDLDIVIIGNLDKIASVQEPFCMIENFSMNKPHCAHNSSVMVWTPSQETSKAYTQFSNDVMKELHGDQCWLWRVHTDNIHNFPQNWIVSYKYEKIPKYRHANADTSIICFHGRPKPHEVRDQNIVTNWK